MPAAPKQPRARVYSRHAREAAIMLGQLIRINRIERKLAVEELATRTGVSRGMMRRIEAGDPRCGTRSASPRVERQTAPASQGDPQGTNSGEG